MAVAYVNRKTVDVEEEPGLEVRIAGRVGVAVNSLDRRDRAELGEHAEASDVARVKNSIDAGQRREEFRPDQTVSIGNQTDEHRSV